MLKLEDFTKEQIIRVIRSGVLLGYQGALETRLIYHLQEEKARDAEKKAEKHFNEARRLGKLYIEALERIRVQEKQGGSQYIAEWKRAITEYKEPSEKEYALYEKYQREAEKVWGL